MADVPQNPMEFGYRDNAEVVISGKEFRALQFLAQKALANGVDERFEQDTEWVNVQTGEAVAKPSKKQIDAGVVVETPSKAATLQNKKVLYNSNLFPEVFDGNEVIFAIHMRNIENDVATPVAVLQQEYQELVNAQNQKGSMQVVADEAPEAEAENSQEVEDPNPEVQQAVEAVAQEEESAS